MLLGELSQWEEKQRSNYKRLIDFMKTSLGISLSIPDNRKSIKPIS